MFGALLVGLAAVSLAQAHALLILADGGDPAKTIVVFADGLAPDPGVGEASWKKVHGLKLYAVDKDGKATDVKWTQEKDHLKAPAPAGTRVVYGTVDFGVYAKGDAKPKYIRFYPKAVIGDPAVKPVGDAVGMEVVCEKEAGKTRFRVVMNGKPVAGAKLTVYVPEQKDEATATTDDQGYTQGFGGVGRYGVVARFEQDKAGEADGKKYEAISHTATLVVDVK
jgi:hypothetical protein